MKKATVELSGPVKWFDPKRGFGFITTNVGDVLLHFSVLKEHGRRSVPEGAVLLVEAFQSDRGLQADKVLSIDLTTAAPPRRSSGSRSTSQPHGDAGPFELLQVKWFDKGKGFGFLYRGNIDVFIHAETVRRGGLPTNLENDAYIEARVAEAAKGLIATEARAVVAQAIAA